ncbi:MAG: hypothetical protein Q9170_002038 [Blastenia crenularia]
MAFPLVHGNEGPEGLSNVGCNILVYLRLTHDPPTPIADITGVLKYMNYVGEDSSKATERGSFTIAFDRFPGDPRPVEEKDVKATFDNIAQKEHPQNPLYAYLKVFEGLYRGGANGEGHLAFDSKKVRVTDAEDIEVYHMAYKQLRASDFSRIEEIKFRSDKRTAPMKSTWRRMNAN